MEIVSPVGAMAITALSAGMTPLARVSTAMISEDVDPGVVNAKNFDIALELRLWKEIVESLHSEK